MFLSAPRSLVLALFGAACLIGSLPAGASTAAKKKPAAPVEAPLADLAPEQVANAERVHLGDQDCEFRQQVKVQRHQAKDGYFHLNFKGRQYTMAPEPTTTGAVRLEDKKNGLVWIQIANKSMLMNARAGQRLVDECVHPSQKMLQPAPAPAAPVDPVTSAVSAAEPVAQAR